MKNPEVFECEYSISGGEETVVFMAYRILKNKKRSRLGVGKLIVSIKSPDPALPNFNFFVESSRVQKKFRGQGVGFKLYESAIQHFGSLSTEYNGEVSALAKRVWKKLSDKYEFEADFWTGRLTVFNRLQKAKKSKK